MSETYTYLGLGALARAEARTRMAARCLRRASRAARNFRAAEIPEVRHLFSFEAVGLALRARDNLELGLLQITSSLKELLGDVLDDGEPLRLATTGKPGGRSA